MTRNRCRVLFANIYDMRRVLTNVRRDQEGRHHLWGVTEFPGLDLDVCIPPFRRRGGLNASARLRRWGDLDQESRLLFRRDFDVLYAAADGVVAGLAFLRGLGLWPRPIVSVFHHPPPGGRHPRLRMRHMPFSIGILERDQWLACMDQAMQETGVPEDLRQRLAQSFFQTADWMRNR